MCYRSLEIIYGPKWLWAEMVMGRFGYGPIWLWAEMTRNQKTQDEVVWYTDTPSRSTQGKPAPHGERRVTLDTMLKIEDAAGVNLPIGTGKFKTRKINADKAK